MAKIISFGNEPTEVEANLKKVNPLKVLWNVFSSQDKFTKFFIITVIMLAVVTPGFVARYFIQAAPTLPAVNLEAESTTLSGPVVLGTDSLASNGQYLLFQSYSASSSGTNCVKTPPSGAGVATSQINIPQTGYYFIWSRIRGQGDAANSYYLQIDNNCLIKVGDQNGMPSNVWTWINYQNGLPSSTIINRLSAGTHTIKLIGKEGNTSIDNLIFTSDSACSPVDTGANCIPASSPTPVPTATPVSGKTASILTSPSTGNYTQGQTFTVDVKVDGGGTAFNAAQATVVVSSNLKVQSLTVTPKSSGGCNFTWANNKNTPTATSPSFSGAIIKSSSLSCTVYTLSLQALSTGTGTVTFTKGSVKSYSTHLEILGSLISGSYVISLPPTPTPTPTPTPVPTPTPTPVPTPTPTPVPTPTPTGVPTPTPTPTPTPVPTPTPTPVPTPTPTPVPTPTPIVLLAPTINAQPLDTYSVTTDLTGTMTSPVSTIFVNGSTTGVVYPSSNTWGITVNLSIGPNTFVVNGKDANGNTSPNDTVTIVNHIMGDINGDGVIDLTDYSLFAVDYENTGVLNSPLSDLNDDGFVDLTDFSILAQQ